MNISRHPVPRLALALVTLFLLQASPVAHGALLGNSMIPAAWKSVQQENALSLGTLQRPVGIEFRSSLADGNQIVNLSLGVLEVVPLRFFPWEMIGEPVVINSAVREGDLVNLNVPLVPLEVRNVAAEQIRWMGNARTSLGSSTSVRMIHGSLSQDYSGSFTYDRGWILDVTVIPEPGTFALVFGLTALGLAGWQRRRLRQLS